MHCELCGPKSNEWLLNHGSQKVVKEISFGTPIYGLHAKWNVYSPGTCFLSIQGRKDKMVCTIVQELYNSETQ